MLYIHSALILYVHQTWSLTLREEQTMAVFKNRLSKKIFESKKEELQKDGEDYK